MLFSCRLQVGSGTVVIEIHGYPRLGMMHLWAAMPWRMSAFCGCAERLYDQN